jgi:hypothetical protein
MELESFTLNSVDRKGNKIRIECEGVDDKELAHFGGLDLTVKAIKTMIGNIHGTDFARDNGDYAIEDKVIALILNEVGSAIRYLSLNSSMLKDYSNMDLVKNFMEHWETNKEVVEVIEKDNELMRLEEEEIKKEEDEIWANIMSDLGKKKN